jgi:alkylated DNA repair dioxygenase AlkB
VKDLFSSIVEFERIDMPDADVTFLRHAPMPRPDEIIFDQLRTETFWRQEKVHVWGKWHDQPRMTAWYGDPGKSYNYSGTVMSPLPWTSLLYMIKREIEELADFEFNSVLLNLYRNQNDRMGFHSDNEASLGPEPTIASLSFGATRTLKLKHKKRPELGIVKIPLTNGSLLLMKGKTQENWAHGIDKEARPCGPRVNLTFRNIRK